MTEEAAQSTPFLKCWLHENKKAYTKYIVWVSAAIDIFAAMLALIWAASTYGNMLLSMLADSITYSGIVFDSAVNAAIEFVSTGVRIFPWWTYIIVLVIAAPMIYSTIVCLERRYKWIGNHMVEIALVSTFLFLVVTFTWAIHTFLIPSSWAASSLFGTIVAVWIMAMLCTTHKTDYYGWD